MTVAMDHIPHRLTGYQPALAYDAPERVPGSGYWKLAPNLAVDILSLLLSSFEVAVGDLISQAS
jgi:hypothetical protein